MCIQPLNIKHPRFRSLNSDFDCHCDKVRLTVPCGHCFECDASKASDIMVRLYFEYKKIQLEGGLVYWDTFTYSPAHVPYYDGVMCFNKKHYRDFMKRLRITLERSGYDIKGKLKVFWCSEYGTSENGTKRPHYHAIFFLYGITIPAWKFERILRSCWFYGRLDRKHSANEKVINSPAAFHYISKYVEKPLDWLSLLRKQAQNADSAVRHLIETSLESDSDIPFEYFGAYVDSEIEHLTYSKLSKHFRNVYGSSIDFVPFRCLSQGLGMSICDYVSIDDIIYNRIKIPDQDSQWKVFSTPSYIDRKLFYSYDSTTKLYTINELGVEVKIMRFGENLPSSSQSVTDFLSNWHTQVYDKQVVLDTLSQDYPDITDVESVHRHVVHALAGRPLAHFCYYMLFYKDRVIDSIPEFTIDGIKHLYQRCYEYPFPECPYTYEHYVNKTYNHLPYFEGFDELCKFFQLLRSYTSCERATLVAYLKKLNQHFTDLKIQNLIV